MFKLLIVNDALLLTEMERSFLKRMACAISVSETETDALEKVRKEKPDVIVLDSATTSVDGFSFCRTLKSAGETKDIPVLFIVSPEEKDKCRESGPDSILKRPFVREDFLKAISIFIDLKERETDRVPLVKKVRCDLRDSPSVEVYSKDLSMSGIFLKSRSPLPVGSELEMDFIVSGKSSARIRCSGEVVRKVEHEKDSHLISGMGIRFKGMKASDRLMIQDYIRNRASGNETHL
jgi:CheY-like chemotaxis protein